MNKLSTVALVAVLMLFTAAMAFASTGPGQLTDNPAGSPVNNYYNPTHVSIVAGTTGTFYIMNATDVHTSTVNVYIKSSDFGNTTVTGTVSGTTITFSWTAPIGGCNTTNIAYGSLGNTANNFLISGGHATSGIALVDAQGNPITTCTTSTCPTLTTTGGALSCDFPVIQLSAGLVGADANQAASATYSWTGPGIVADGNTATPSVNVAGTYFVTVSGLSPCDDLTGSAVVDPNPNPCFNPLFCTVSDPQTVCEGGSVTFTAEAHEGLPFTDGSFHFAWYRATDPITVIGTSATLTIDPVHLSDAGKYIVTITDSVGEISTCVTGLAVNPLPTFASFPSDTTLSCGGASDPSVTGSATSDNADVTSSDASAGDCPVVITRTWTATNGCGTINRNQTITVVPQSSISGVKFYDVNKNGVQDEGEAGIPNWKIVLSGASSATAFTDANGAYSFGPLCQGSYTVAEVIPPKNGPYSWTNTTSLSQNVTLGCPAATVNFGNVCTGTPGGLTIGFWSNKNGQALENSADLAALRAFCLVNSNGTAFDPLTVASLAKWFTSQSASNMASMLSAQMAATYLNVQHGKTVAAVLIDGGRDVNAEITYGNSLLCQAGGNNTVGASALRTEQERVKNIFDKLNNGGGFTQSSSCGVSYPTEANHKPIENPIANVTVVPSAFALLGNYPNPFNPTTNIAYDLADAGQVTLKVYDILGREVASLVNGVQSAGHYAVQFDGSSLSNGVYFYRLQAGSFTATKSLLLMK